MHALLDNRLRLPLSGLSSEQLQALQTAFTYENPQHKRLKAMRMRFSQKKIKEFIHTWEVGGGYLSLPRGGMERVRAVLGPLRVTKWLSWGDPALAGQIPDHVLKLRGYQHRLKRGCLDNQLALIRSPPGSGKTTIGYSIAAELKLPTLVVVPTERIFLQWVRGVEKNLGMDPSEVGIIQGKTKRIRPLTIGMQQTLRNCADEYAETFGVVILDECQRAGAETFFDVIDKLKAAYRIGMSADERRADKKEFLVYDVFGPVLEEVPRQELIDEGAIIDAEILVIPTEFTAKWYTKLEGMKRANAAVQTRLDMELEGNAARNELILDCVRRFHREGKPNITLAWSREHCSTLNAMPLAEGMNSGLLMGGADSRHEFTRTERELTDGELQQAVGTYQAVGVGFDLPRVSRGIFAAPCASNQGRQQFGQFAGRYERPDIESGKVNQGDAKVVYIWDREVFGINPVRNIARWKPNVKVLSNRPDFRFGEWVDAKEYIKWEQQNEARAAEEDDASIGFRSAH